MTNIVAIKEQTTIRPLKVLIALIQQDIEEANHAAETASMPYWLSAGEKLLEAKGQLDHGEFEKWVLRNFNIGLPHARRLMRLAKPTLDMENVRRHPSSMMEALRQASPHAKSYQKENLPVRPQIPQDTARDIKHMLNDVDVDFLNKRRDELKRAEERSAQRELALKLIDIGYKALASKLHPDKGGSRDAMARLNAVRDRLKNSV